MALRGHLGRAPGIRLILASTSPQRRAILEQLRIPFDVVPPDYEEVEGTSPLERAAGKARSVDGGERPVLGVDTEVLFEGVLLGKPADATEAERMLEALSGRTHEVVSGLCLRTRAWEELHEATTHVTFRAPDASGPRALRRGRRVGGTSGCVRDPGTRCEPRRTGRGRLPERRRTARVAPGRAARLAVRRRLRLRLMTRMHEDELPIGAELVRRLVEEQFPDWSMLPLERVEPSGTDNAIYRLGDELAVRLPRRDGSTSAEDREHDWLPRLAPALPVEVPLPVARGRPGPGYPWYWSVVRWLEGGTPLGVAIDAGELAELLACLQRIDPTGGPSPGAQRGEPLATRDPRVRVALENLEVPGAADLWRRAVDAPEWHGDLVWLHADLDARNILVRERRLTGVIDWGCVGIGDPAVDLMAAWKLLDAPGRERFRELLDVDDVTWLRAEGWALSQALIALDYYTLETYPILVHEARRWLAEVLRS